MLVIVKCNPVDRKNRNSKLEIDKTNHERVCIRGGDPASRGVFKRPYVTI